MAWFKIDDKLHDHPKVRKLRVHKLAALGLWTACGSWSADTLSDGFVPAEIVQRFDPDEGLAKRLVEVGLWNEDEHDDEVGYRFHQWTDHQPTKAEVERRREEARERMRRRRAGATEPDANPTSGGSQDVRANTPRTSSEVRHPDPTRPLTTSSLATADAAARFDEWWTLYPRKTKKLDARKAFTAAVKAKVDADHLITSLRRQVEAWRVTNQDPTFIPYPATWLRAGSYDDDFGQTHLSLVPAPPSLLTFEDYRDQGAAVEAARLLGIAYIPAPQPPSDGTSSQQWASDRAVEWIEAHEQEIRAALTERKTG